MISLSFMFGTVSGLFFMIFLRSLLTFLVIMRDVKKALPRVADIT